MKYSFEILVRSAKKEAVVTIFSVECNVNLTEQMTVLDMARRVMPIHKWSLDDGEDERGTKYCQYTCYVNKKDDEYLLAVWDEFED